VRPSLLAEMRWCASQRACAEFLRREHRWRYWNAGRGLTPPAKRLMLIYIGLTGDYFTLRGMDS